MRTSNNGHARRVAADPIDVLTRDIAAIKRDITQLIGEGAGNVKYRAREAASRVQDEAVHVAEQAKEQYDVAHEALAKNTAARPVTTIIVALAAGAVIGKLAGWMMRR